MFAPRVVQIAGCHFAHHHSTNLRIWRYWEALCQWSPLLGTLYGMVCLCKSD